MIASGDASPTVILENGLGGEQREWSAVQSAIERFARVVSYDRSSRGMSDAAPVPRSASDLVDDLRALIDRAGIPGPFVLVGHSVGGLIARLFAHRYPRDTVGLVLVESMHEGEFDRVGSALPPSPHDEPLEVQRFRYFSTVGWRRPSTTPGNIDLPASFAQARAASTLGDLPLRVLSAGKAMPASMPEPLNSAMQRLHDEVQRELMRLSSRSRHIAVAGCGPAIPHDDPQAIVEAVQSIIEDLT